MKIDRSKGRTRSDEEEIMKIFDACPECDGVLEFIAGLEPYTIDHLMCDKCDGTYCLDE